MTRRAFLVLPVGYSLADVKWLPTDLEADPEAALEADLDRDGARRRWLGAPASVVERYRAEVEAAPRGQSTWPSSNSDQCSSSRRLTRRGGRTVTVG